MHSLSDIATILNECQRPGNLRKHGRKVNTEKSYHTKLCNIYSYNMYIRRVGCSVGFDLVTIADF